MQKNNNLLKDRAFLEINLNNLEHNINQIKQILSSKTKIMAVIKANAYGHDSILIAKKLSELGICDFAVATLEEAMLSTERKAQTQQAETKVGTTRLSISAAKAYTLPASYSVSIETKEQLLALLPLADRFCRFYLPAELLLLEKELSETVCTLSEKTAVFLTLPYILRDADATYLKQVLSLRVPDKIDHGIGGGGMHRLEGSDRKFADRCRRIRGKRARKEAAHTLSVGCRFFFDIRHRAGIPPKGEGVIADGGITAHPILKIVGIQVIGMRVRQQAIGDLREIDPLPQGMRQRIGRKIEEQLPVKQRLRAGAQIAPSPPPRLATGRAGAKERGLSLRRRGAEI